MHACMLMYAACMPYVCCMYAVCMLHERQREDGWIIWSTDWLIRWLTDWLIDWLTDWLIDWSIDWLISWKIEKLIDWQMDRLYRVIDSDRLDRIRFHLIRPSLFSRLLYLLVFCTLVFSLLFTTTSDLPFLRNVYSKLPLIVTYPILGCLIPSPFHEPPPANPGFVLDLCLWAFGFLHCLSWREFPALCDGKLSGSQ